MIPEMKLVLTDLEVQENSTKLCEKLEFSDMECNYAEKIAMFQHKVNVILSTIINGDKNKSGDNNVTLNEELEEDYEEDDDECELIGDSDIQEDGGVCPKKKKK